MYIKVHAVAGARKEKVERQDQATFAISVREPAKQNLANKRIKEILCEEYTVEGSAVRLVSGHRSQSKIFDVELKA
ncbi:MAG: DUF167 family protein [Candidatus Paceibacterota bacterium]